MNPHSLKGDSHKEVTPEKKTSSLEFILYSVRQIGICRTNYTMYNSKKTGAICPCHSVILPHPTYSL
jgi:hypothetical protein